MTEPRTVDQLLIVGERVLNDSSALFEDHDHRQEAEDLLRHALGVDGGRLDGSTQIPLRKRERFLALVARRAAGEPFPILVGRINFYGLDLRVWPGAFVPRPSSELTCARAARRLRGRRNPIVVDACTGAGPIALGIADEFPGSEVWGTDISEPGIKAARANAKRLGLGNVHFRRGDMLDALPSRLKGRVDLMTAHVPYVPVHELEDLPAEVKEFEPLHTLTDQSSDGLDLLRRAAYGGAEWLRPGGWLLLEISEDLVRRVKRICLSAGLVKPTPVLDEDRLSVVVEARKPKANPRARSTAR